MTPWEYRVQLAQWFENHRTDFLETAARALDPHVAIWRNYGEDPRVTWSTDPAPDEAFARLQGLWDAFGTRVLVELGTSGTPHDLLAADSAARSKANAAREAAYREALKDLGALNG